MLGKVTLLADMLCQDSFRSYIHVELIFIVLRAINRSKCHNFMSMQICKCNGPLRPRAYGGRGAGASVFLRMQERSADISQRSFDIENRHFIFRKIIDDFIEPCILFSALLHLGHPSTESVMHDDDEARPNSQNFQGVMNQGLQNPREIVGRMVRFLTGHAFLQNAMGLRPLLGTYPVVYVKIFSVMKHPIISSPSVIDYAFGVGKPLVHTYWMNFQNGMYLA